MNRLKAGYTLLVILASFVLLAFQTFSAKHGDDFIITNYGAIGDGKTLCTGAIQMAIDKASVSGGRVVIPKGIFLSGTIHLKSSIELHLSEGAVLLGSTDWHKYQKGRWYSLILAVDQTHISITGQGAIDGQGAELAEHTKELVIDGTIKDSLHASAGRQNLLRANENWRPQIIEMTRCSQIHVSGITLKNSAGWLQNYRVCKQLEVDHIHVFNTAYWNNDGIDVSDCSEVKVHDSDFDVADDGVCLKSGAGGLNEDVEVWNCKIRCSGTAFKCGTASGGGFKRIKVHNLEVYDVLRTAIGLDMVDGGVLENVDVYNVRARHTGGAIFIRLGRRNTNVAIARSQLRNVHIHHVTVEVAGNQPDSGHAFKYPF